VSRVQSRTAVFAAALAPLRDSRAVGEVRQMGMIAGIELTADKAARRKFAPELAAARVLGAQCLAQGLIVRAIGDAVAIASPLIISDAEIGLLATRLSAALRGIEAALGALA
jgi:4-aminobutyrate---pyruvate transaminase